MASSLVAKPPAQCCTTGFRHEGTTTGKLIKIAGKHDAYVAEPDSKVKKDAALLFIPDVMGISQNAQLLADQFAENGYYTVIVDPFNGDALQPDRPKDFDFMKWLNQGSDGKNPHTPEVVDGIVSDALQELKSLGFKKIGALGYCFGAKYVLRHYKNGVQVGFVAHPSFCTEDELKGITGPLSIAAAETDRVFPTESRHGSEALLQESGQHYQINLFGQVSHGFSVRCDLSVKVQRFAKEQAFSQAVSYMDTFLLD